jgi:uncharacterized protein (DUF2062 family)
MNQDGFFYRKVYRPLLDMLQQGVTPEKLALSLALGAVLGVFPAIGWTTTICAVVAFAWGLNLPAIQLMNYAMYPLQLALLIPFFRMGEKLFRAHHLAISMGQIYSLERMNFWHGFAFLWSTTWHAMVVWILIAPIATAILYYPLVPMLRRLSRRLQTSEPMMAQPV